MRNIGNHVDIVAKVDFLRRPNSYPDSNGSIEVIETHRSFVFLTDDHAYKMKKPICNKIFDFNSLDARRRNCHHEVRLNRRLAENVYLGVVPLTIDEGGRMLLEGNGEPVEWLVKMRKLNRDRMLDYSIVHATVTPGEIESVGRLLGTFYLKASPTTWSAAQYLHQLDEAIYRAKVELRSFSFGLSIPQIDEVANRLRQCANDHRVELIQRLLDGRIIDAHGDLRPEHICLEEPPVIIDCLEFNDDLRILDAASEMCFLTQECELLGGVEISQHLWKQFLQRASDCVTHELRTFYCAYHAFLRASLAISHLRDQGIRHPEIWKPKAQRYLDLASSQLP
ncbi:MAG: hypothetical protein SFV81_25200 [Pirellulaceae bacterium]|nr:hypothetical protein [Pirellulaceae bacterium]